MKRMILFLALMGFLAGNTANGSIITQYQPNFSQVWLDDDPPQAKETKEAKTTGTTKTACCDKGVSKKSCCDSKKPDAKPCCDKGPKDNCKPGQEPKK